VAQDGFVLTHSILAHLPHFLLGISAGYGFWRLSLLTDERRKALQNRFEAAFWMSAAIALAVLSTSLDGLVQIPFGRYHFPLVPCLIAFMIVSVAFTRWARAVLESAPLRRLGVISFGIYIYHLPCLNLVARGIALFGKDPAANGLSLGALGLLCSIVVATASYVVIERPLLRVTRGQPPFRVSARPEGARSADQLVFSD
jgi:peptidoglycan/LPS O-acetylase OafA/YrhL